MTLFDYIPNDPFRAYCQTAVGRKSHEFDRENPHVFEMFERFAKEARNRGHQRYSANGIFERMRWETHMTSNDNDFKLSNNLRAYYARKLMASDETFVGFFTVKGRK